MKKLALIFAFTIISSTFVMAQKPVDDYDKGEVFVGYSSHLYVDDPGPLINVTSRGINTSAVYNFHRYWGVKADASISFSRTVSQSFVPGVDNPTMARVSYSQQLNVSTFTVGIQLKDNEKDNRFKPFAHALAGVGRLENKVRNAVCTSVSNCSNVPPNEVSTGFALLLGGGLDIKLNHRIDIRAVQLDLSGIYGDSNAVYFRGGSNDFRFGAGVVFKF